MKQLRKNPLQTITSLVISILLTISSIPYHVYGGYGGGSNKAEIDYFNGDEVQYFRFYVSSTASNAKYKYKTIGWKMYIKPRGATTTYTGTYPFTFSSETQDKVDLPLQRMFDYIDSPSSLPQEYREVGGDIEVDAIQQILVNNVPKHEYTDEASNIINGLTQHYGISWGPNTLNDLPNYYNIKESYDPVSEEISISVNPQRYSTIDEQTVEIDKGETNAIVKIKVEGDISPTDKQVYAKDYRNIRYIQVTLGDQTKKLYPNIDFTSLHYSTDFTFEYTPEEIGVGGADVIGEELKSYTCKIEVEYNLQYRGNAVGSEDARVYKRPSKDPRPPIAIIDSADEVLLGTYVRTDGSSSYARDGASIVNYIWSFDGIEKPMDEGKTLSGFPGNTAKTVHVKLIVIDDNGNRGTTTKEVVVLPPGPRPPIAIIEAPDEVVAGEQIIADGSSSYARDGATLTKYTWEMDTLTQTGDIARFTINAPTTITVKLTVEDNNNKTASTTKDIHVKAKPKPVVNFPPSVLITGPSIVLQGDPFTFRTTAEDKEDGSLTPILSKPSSMTLSQPVHNGDNTAVFHASGHYTIGVKAIDSNGQEDTDSMAIEVCPPMPLAIITESGDYKVGQTVILDSSKSKAISRTYPIDWTLTKWEITPLGSLTESDIFHKRLNDKEIAFTSKKTGNVEISLTVTNTLGFSNTRTIVRTIQGDSPPIADFKILKTVYRDKDDDKKATLKAFDMSKSPDGDIMTKRVWFYAFDSNNDGVFDNESWYYHNGNEWTLTGTNYLDIFTYADTVEPTANLTEVELKSTHVGKYRFALKVYEEHDNRLFEFVDTSYILTSDTSNKVVEDTITEIDNIAPVTAVKVDVSNNETIDMVVLTDYSALELLELQTQLNLLKAEGFANAKHINIHLITDQVNIGKQHKIKKYYTYSRNIYLSYFLESGDYQYSGPGGNRYESYNHDPRYETIQYETTQGYTTPNKPFEKGDEVSWERGYFSRSEESMFGGYQKSGVEFRFFNPNNKVGTLSTRQITTQGSYQGINFCQVWNGIVVGGEQVNVTNHWTQTNSFVEHPKEYDIKGIDVSQVEKLPFNTNSKKVLMYFAKGTGFDYEITNANNYVGGSLNKGFLDYLTYNDFETYVIAPESILDFKFDNNNHQSDINNQYASLKELATSSSVRGKYVIGDISSDLWKKQISHIYKKNISMPHKVEVENNVMTFTFDKDFNIDDEMDISILQQQMKISDLVGNKITDPLLTYKVKVEDAHLKELSSLVFSNPLVMDHEKTDMRIKEINDYVVIYQEGSKLKVFITHKGKEYFTDNELQELESLNYANVKDIEAVGYGIAVLFNTNRVKSYGHILNGNYRLDSSKWTNIKKVYSGANHIVGEKYDGTLIQSGAYRQYYGDLYYVRDKIIDSYNDYTDVSFAAVGGGVLVSYRTPEGYKYTSGIGLTNTYVDYNSIKRKHYTDSVEIIGSPVTTIMYMKLHGRYYKYTGNYETPLEALPELNGMSIKKLIPLGTGFIAIKQDDSLYYSQELQDSLRSNYHYYNTLSRLQQIGTLKNIAYMGSGLWIQGTTGDVYLNGVGGADTINGRYIKIDDIERIVTDMRPSDNMLIITKDGYRHNLMQMIDDVTIPSNALYYFSDRDGHSYMTSTGYFYSSTLPNYNASTWHSYRRFSGQYKKVIIGPGSSFLALTHDGRVQVYRRPSNSDDDYYSYLDYYNYQRDVVDMMGGFLFYKDGRVGSIHKGNLPVYYNYYNSYKDKNIRKYLLGYYNHRSYLFGLDTSGVLWRTDEKALTRVATDIDDIFTIDGYLVYLKEDGTLSDYGHGRKYETYDNMITTFKFITLKLKGRNEKVMITRNGIQMNYIGGFRDKYERIQYLRSTQIHVGRHQDDGVAFYYKIFTDDPQSVEEILFHQKIDETWTEVVDKDIIPVTDGYYIGVVEVNANHQIIRYSHAKAKAENL